MSGLVRAVDLARVLGVSRPRVSQYVSEGRLEGCYTGEGNQRRFDVAKVAAALGRRLDAGQMLGNGRDTKRRLSELRAEGQPELAPPRDREPRDPAPRRDPPAGATLLEAGDNDRYELARIVKAEEEARRIRRQNAQEEGQYVLAASVESQIAKLLAQENAEIEGMLREAARAVADRLGVDARTVRQVLIDTWRGHRTHRAAALQADAKVADLTAEEKAEDI